jgi:hypothetical protein
MATRGRDLRTGDHEHAVVIALEGPDVDVVVVGNHHELRARRTSGSNDVVRRSGSV